MPGRARRDSGQAFPVYIAVVAGLLFLAFAYFAVGQAAFTRNSAQTAADAAALAAAQDAREQLREGWIEVILDPGQWGGFLGGLEYDPDAACDQAAEFAARNGAALSGDTCVPLDSGGFRVTVRTNGPESNPATASASAVIEPLCEYKEQEPPSEPPPSTPTPPDEGDEEEEGPIMGLMCDGVAWEIDPEKPTLPGAVDLFTVRLSE
ncbi:pilus assembly protein TadG-related protein [Streptomyces sp. NPDC050842]|uniref:pilus assembly protein TadG-related protein n=1 Tax=Streptomyces sp. NPDC050842 TaxID=3365636 RepID=UPI00379D6C4C